jgi:hypothetical protein
LAQWVGEPCEDITVEFTCEVYDPVNNGDKCDECNDDSGLKECNEYRCWSLGDYCVYENDVCIEENYDGTPLYIFPGEYRYPTDIIYNKDGYGETDDITNMGFEVTTSSGDCFDPYELIGLQVETNRRAICYYSTESGTDIEDMDELFGTDFYLTNHTLTFLVPNPSGGENQGVTYDYTLYVKCIDVFDNENNEGEYVIDMCINEGDDTNPPEITDINPENGGYVSTDSSLYYEEVTLYADQPVDCRWSKTNTNYFSMENNFTCTYDTYSTVGAYRGYDCTADIPITSDESTFYIDCLDQPWLGEDDDERNTMKEVYEYTLVKPDSEIRISAISPTDDEEVETTTNPATTEITVTTAGGGDEHICEWSLSGFDTMADGDYNSDGSDRDHVFNLLMTSGDHTIYFNCSDETGDYATEQVTFTTSYDNIAPIMVRQWYDSGKVYIITNEEADCRYSIDDDDGCSFDYDEAEKMLGSNNKYYITADSGEWYYIKCEDEYGIGPTNSNACTTKVQAVAV